MADSKFTVSGDNYYTIDGIMLDIKRQLRQKGGSPLDPEKVILALQKIDESKFDRELKENKILRLISRGESLILDAENGKETLANAKDLFVYIDSDFKNYGVNESGLATNETATQVYEVVKDANFSEIFGSLNTDVSKLCLTQAQIKQFVKRYRSWLRIDGYGTFFPFKNNNQFFVASVRVGSGGALWVYVPRFESSLVWRAGNRHRVVVPQLA